MAFLISASVIGPVRMVSISSGSVVCRVVGGFGLFNTSSKCCFHRSRSASSSVSRFPSLSSTLGECRKIFLGEHSLNWHKTVEQN